MSLTTNRCANQRNFIDKDPDFSDVKVFEPQVFSTGNNILTLECHLNHMDDKIAYTTIYEWRIDTEYHA